MTGIANFVQQTSVSTGTGAMVLTAQSGCRSFASAFGTGGNDMFFYFIRHRSAAEWEVGTGHMADAATLVRDNVISSSNGGAKVAFSAGEKDVVNDIAAERQMVLPAAPDAGDMLIFDGSCWQAAKPGVDTIDGLPDALSGKADAVHGHSADDIEGLDSWLSDKAAATHDHSFEDIGGLDSALSGKADKVHGHNADDIADLDDVLAGYAAAAHGHEVDEIDGLGDALAAKAAANHNHDITDVSGLQTALDAKAPASRNIAASGSLTGGGDLSANRSLSLIGDEDAPGNGKYYGTDGSGNKGFHALPVPPAPAAGEVGLESSTHLFATGADVQAALTAMDGSLQRAGFHPLRSVNFNHFTGSDNGPFIAANSGSGANAATIESDYTVNTDALGVYRLTTGTTASGAALRGLGTAAIVMHDAGKSLRIKSRIRLANLTAAGSQEFRVWGGIAAGTAATTNPAAVPGMYWYYDKGNAHWVLRRRNTAFVQDVATDVAVEAGVWYDMELAVYGDSSDSNVTCELFINGVSKAVNSQLIGGMGYNAVSAAIQKTAGTTARLLYIDYEALFMARGS